MTYDINLVLQINRGEHPNPKAYDHLVDFFNQLKTPADIDEERVTISKIDTILQLETLEQRFTYAEWEIYGVIFDNGYEYFCWLDGKQYTPRLVLNYATGELYLVYVLDDFHPRFKIEKENLLDMLNEWEKYISNR